MCHGGFDVSFDLLRCFMKATLDVQCRDFPQHKKCFLDLEAAMALNYFSKNDIVRELLVRFKAFCKINKPKCCVVSSTFTHGSENIKYGNSTKMHRCIDR